jgi:hypothetical protein
MDANSFDFDNQFRHIADATCLEELEGQLEANCLMDLERGLWRAEFKADPRGFILPRLPLAVTMLAALASIPWLFYAATTTL